MDRTAYDVSPPPMSPPLGAPDTPVARVVSRGLDAGLLTWQGVFAALVTGNLVLRTTTHSGFDPAAAAGLVGVLLASCAALLLPRLRSLLDLDPEIVVALANLLVVGICELDGDATGAVVLATLPAVRLGRHLGARGSVVTVVGCGLFVVLPTVALLGLGDGGAAGQAGAVARVVLGSAVAVIASSAVAGAVTEADRGRRTLAATVDAAPVGLILIDADGGYHSMNNHMEQVLRLAYPDTVRDDERDEARSAGQALIFAEDGVTPLSAEQWPSARARRGEVFDDMQIWVGERSGPRRAYSVSGRAVRGPRGELTGATVACNDVTELVEALHVKDDFVSSVSHELRTPLTSINGYTQLLLEREDLAPDVRRPLEVVARNSTRLTHLVSDLLATAQRGGDAMSDLVRGECDAASLVTHAVQSAQPAADAKRLELSLTAPLTLPAYVDGVRVAQAVDNLLTNAIKYTPAGGAVSVEVAQRIGSDATYVDIAVSDTGVGLAPSDVERVFDRFFRTVDAREAALPGIGLGLGIVREIVQAHDGTIEVSSVPGEGSTFRISLPLVAASRPFDALAARPEAVAAPVDRGAGRLGVRGAAQRRVPQIEAVPA